MRTPDNLDEPVKMVQHPDYPSVWIEPENQLTPEQQQELIDLSRDGNNCRVAIHHGPGHQSTTECEVEGDHIQHRVLFGEFFEFARWTGHRDVFSNWYDEFDEEKIEYVRDDWTLRRRRRIAYREE